MQCNSCSNDVPQKFAYAITQNVCPFCGEAIMEVALQKILASLHDAMTEAVELDYTTLALDWVSSNFNLVSREDQEYLSLQAEITAQRHDTTRAELELAETKRILEQTQKELEEAKLNAKPAKPTPKSGQAPKTIQLGKDAEGHDVQLQGETIQDPDKTNEFLKRAQVKPATNSEHFRKMVAKIKKGGGGAGGGDLDMSQYMNSSPEELEALEHQMETAISGFNGPASIRSSIDVSDSDDEPLPSVVQSFINGGGQGAGNNAHHAARAKTLQQDSANRSRELDRGGSVGLIRR